MRECPYRWVPGDECAPSLRTLRDQSLRRRMRSVGRSGAKSVANVLLHTVEEDLCERRQSMPMSRLELGSTTHHRPLPSVDGSNALEHPLTVARGAGAVAPIAGHGWRLV